MLLYILYNCAKWRSLKVIIIIFGAVDAFQFDCWNYSFFYDLQGCLSLLLCCFLDSAIFSMLFILSIVVDIWQEFILLLDEKVGRVLLSTQFLDNLIGNIVRNIKSPLFLSGCLIWRFVEFLFLNRFNRCFQ